MSPLSGVLTETWALYRRYAAHFLLIAFVIYLVAAVLVALLSLAGIIVYFLGEIIELTAVFLLPGKVPGHLACRWPSGQ